LKGTFPKGGPLLAFEFENEYCSFRSLHFHLKQEGIVGKTRVLYIEDDEHQRKSLVGQLRSKGYSVTASSSGKAGLKWFSRRTFDIILCDLHMTPLSGLDILDKVREKDSDIPFLILTAHGKVPQAVTAIKKGAHHFILKPPEINEIDITIKQTIEQVGMQRKFRESQDTLRLVYENIPDIIYSMNPRGEFLSLSSSVESVLGYEPSRYIGSSVFDFIHPDDRKGIGDALAESVRTGKPRVRILEFRMVSKAGEVKHFEVSRKLVLEDGKLVRIDGIARDVTERTRLVQQLKDYSADLENKNTEMERILGELSKKKEELQAIINSSPDIIFLINNEGIVQAINTRVTQLFGILPEDIIYRSFDEFTERIRDSFDDFDKFRAQVERLKKTPDRSDDCADKIILAELFERGVTVSSHKPAILAPFSMRVLDEEDHETGRVWIYADITPMKAAAEQLHTIVRASPIPTIISRIEDGKILYANEQLASLIGLSTGDLIGKHTPDFYYNPEDRKIVLESLKRDGYLKNFETQIKKADGSVIWMLFSIVVTEVSGEPVILGGLYDINEIKKVQNDLEEANKNLRETHAQLIQSEKMASLGTLVAGIAHEINTPIGAVSSMHDTLFRTLGKLKEMIEKKFPGTQEDLPKFKAVMKIIDDSNKVIKPGTERVINIVRRLRSFARLDEAEVKTVDIHDGIEDTLVLIHHELKHNITVKKEYGRIPQIACFPGQLNQVFLNLLVNARQAIKGKGEITIRTFVEDNRVHISFTDTGIGIADGDLNKVFDPGFTTKGVGVGTGLGLSICYKIIEDHRGEIKLASKVGKGATFTIILPTNLDELISKDNADHDKQKHPEK
jgi:PAS domain S-box-containing protein